MAVPLVVGESMHLAYPTKVVFDSVTVGIEEGDRIGVVGRNGDGKSSLLGMLGGSIEPLSGRVTRRGGVRFGMLSQRDDLDPAATVGHSIVGDRPDHEWAGDAGVREVIGGLVADLPWDAAIGSLSGGQQRRVALAALLVGEWDVIALDEPTNHLDIEGQEDLEEQLEKSDVSCIFVSHDRFFTRTVATRFLEIRKGRLVETDDADAFFDSQA